MARFGNLTFQNAALSQMPVLCAYPSLFTPLEIESVTVRIIRSLINPKGEQPDDAE